MSGDPAARGGLGVIATTTTGVLALGAGGSDATAAALVLGLAEARRGRSVLVLITAADARRWAGGLGAGDPGPFGARPVPNATGASTDGMSTDGALSLATVDARATMERLVREQASVADAARMLRNPVFVALAGSEAGARFALLERWRELRAAGRWDVVITAAPSTRRAAELLEAPDRFVRFFDHAVYRGVTGARGPLARVADAAASVFTWAVRGLAGPDAVDDALAFLRSVSEMEAGLRARAGSVADLLRSPAVAHVVVVRPDAAAVTDAEELLAVLREQRLTVGAVVVDELTPSPPALPAGERERLERAGDGPLAHQLRWHAQLTADVAAEQARLAGLLRLAGTTVVELAGVEDRELDLGTLTDLVRQVRVRRSGWTGEAGDDDAVDRAPAFDR